MHQWSWTLLLLSLTMLCLPAIADPAEFGSELHAKGWLVYSARGAGGTWDLFLCRPDGTDRRNITETPEWEEAVPRFSPDGTRILYRQLESGSEIDHDKWGFQGRVVIADADGSDPALVGEDGEFPWASWSPDGKQISCLAMRGIQVIELESRKELRQLPRRGIYQQLYWSPDGKWFCGVANHQGESWTVVRMDAATGDTNPVRTFQNCTPDWAPDSQRIILSSRPSGQKANDGYGYTQLWVVSGDGAVQQLVYASEGWHIYGGALSPDGKYVLFTKAAADGGGTKEDGGIMCVMRLSDAPAISGPSPELRALHPQTKDGPVLELGKGWEPHWTYSDVESMP